MDHFLNKEQERKKREMACACFQEWERAIRQEMQRVGEKSRRKQAAASQRVECLQSEAKFEKLPREKVAVKHEAWEEYSERFSGYVRGHPVRKISGLLFFFFLLSFTFTLKLFFIGWVGSFKITLIKFNNIVPAIF